MKILFATGKYHIYAEFKKKVLYLVLMDMLFLWVINNMLRVTQKILLM
tara:strand:+ start:52 stop:195 length:144 start_codon:yes stop_codon:yes gene_type:complete